MHKLLKPLICPKITFMFYKQPNNPPHKNARNEFKLEIVCSKSLPVNSRANSCATLCSFFYNAQTVIFQYLPVIFYSQTVFLENIGSISIAVSQTFWREGKGLKQKRGPYSAHNILCSHPDVAQYSENAVFKYVLKKGQYNTDIKREQTI